MQFLKFLHQKYNVIIWGGISNSFPSSQPFISALETLIYRDFTSIEKIRIIDVEKRDGTTLLVILFENLSLTNAFT